MVPKPATVGIIGAGVSGVGAAIHLKAQGLDVTVFERSSCAGGVWIFDERLPVDPSYPSVIPSEADFTAVIGEDEWLKREEKLGFHHDEEIGPEIWHAPPGPAYEHLTNNVPTELMELKVNFWKPGTASNVNHKILAEYIQDTASKFDTHSYTLYDTRVDRVFKVDRKWQVETTTLKKRGSDNPQKIKRYWKFDKIIVATGHYHACRIPDIPGLAEWKRTWPNRIQHSKRYRRAKDFIDKTVLLVGGSVSSTDIARELGRVSKKIYQVSRGGLFDLPENWLPENAVRVGEIASFDTQSTSNGFSVRDSQAIPYTVTLKNGDVLSDIDSVLLCTGYHMSFPFLKEFHRDSKTPDEADDAAIITDGTQMHNLHKDIFYIPDPSLAFIGVPFFTATFSFFEFQSIAVAAVFSGKADLPAEEDMKAEYKERIEKKGSGKAFHSLKSEETEYVDALVAWINRDGQRSGQVPVEGHSDEWKAAKSELMEVMKKRFSR